MNARSMMVVALVAGGLFGCGSGPKAPEAMARALGAGTGRGTLAVETLGNQARAAAAAAGPAKAPSDFNGDGKSDLLWQGGTDVYTWFLNGGNYTYAYYGAPPAPWRVVGVGDFDGDGNADVLWRNGTDMYVWFMKGTAPYTYAYVAAPPSPWEVEGVGDFDGDGKADLFWRNGTDGYLWFMNGGSFTWAYVAPPPAPWTVAGVGDFDGDGRSDLMWRNGTDVYVWFLNGGNFTWAYFGSPPEPWGVAGVGDFDGDGVGDVLWKNGTDMYVWYMHGQSAVTSDYVMGLDAPWYVAQVGDFDGDGKSDLMWRSGSDLQAWYMNGPRHTAGWFAGPPSPWEIASGRPAPLGVTASRVAAGPYHSHVVDSSGTSWAWGQNGQGRLGDGTQSDSSSPVPFGSGFSAVASGDAHAVAVKADGTLWAWGWNGNGQLGDGTTTDRWSPVLIGGGFAAAAAGAQHTVAIKVDGTLWAWGWNGAGQLGDGNTTDRWSPMLIGAGFQAVAAGRHHTVAIKTDGTLWAWGGNAYGMLGDGTTTDRWSPVLVGTGYQAVAAGDLHTVAIKTDGTLWAWGLNSYGQVGDGATGWRLSPTMIGSNFKAAAGGHQHTVAIKTDGTLWAWGFNANGQVGDGTTADRLSPVLIGGGFAAVDAGASHTVAIKADGTLWAWGWNGYGQLGDGTYTDRWSPAPILLPAQMAPVTALKQTAGAGQGVIQPPAVQVRNASEAPVAGVSVDFVVTAGGGVLSRSQAITDASGVARLGWWAFGAAGAQAVQASTRGIPGASVTFNGWARDAGTGFDVTLRPVSALTDGQLRAFVNAKERIQEVIVGDLVPISMNFTAADLAWCGAQAVNEVVDDVLIMVEIVPIDGAGGVLGQAGPCYIRNTGSLPILGHMQFDLDDVNWMEANGMLDAVILHEMMHVIGFGTLWEWFTPPLVAGIGTDPHFTGLGAIDAFVSANGGNTYAGVPVPVENTGGAGTINSHWRESVFKSELMTGWISGTTQALSLTTAASLQDLGYVVDLSKADPFSILTALQAGQPGLAGPTVFVGDDVRPFAPVPVDASGRPVAP